MFKLRYAFAVGSALAVLVSSSSAITIIGTFVGDGGALPGGVGNAGPAGSTAGGGTLTSIFNTAASYWENAILDTFTVNITYGWQSLSGGTLGVHNLLAQSGTPNRETDGMIRFDNDAATLWFADSTPLDHSEYGTYNEFTSNLGGGTMNVGRVYTGATGNASGRYDLLSVAMHEIGHSLGLSSANNSFVAGNGDLDVDVTSPRPFPGAAIPTVSGAHLNLANALMFPSVSAGRRNLISEADVIANMEISQFTQYNPVPEPASMVALGVGALAVIRRRRKNG